MKRITLLFMLLIVAVGSLFAQVQTNGEYVDFTTGTPTQDHFFVRGTYNDQGTSQVYDNVVSFKGGSPQLVWIYLNDDEIYMNEAIQALTPQDYRAGSPYHEITYNSFQFDIYLPQGIVIVIIDPETGDLYEPNDYIPQYVYVDYYVQGDRLPGTSTLSWAKKSASKVIDGVNYDVYTFTCYNDRAVGTHFSAKNASLYEQNGALKKDATLFGIYVLNKNQDVVEGRMNGDMILGNTLLTLRETDEIFFFGTGGKGVEPRYMQFNRVKLYGSMGIDENIVYVNGITLNKTNAELLQGETTQLNATVFPSNASNKSVIWSTSNSHVATVNSNGLVTAIAPGTATISATATDGSNLSASCEVTVTRELDNYNNYLSMYDMTAFQGDTIVIPVTMTNTASIISFQTDIYLPEGLTLLQEDGDYLIDPSDRMTRTHSIMSNDVSNGSIRVVCYSSNYKPFTGNSGDDLFYITVKVADDAEGDYTIQLKNTLFTTSNFEEIAGPDVAANVHVKAYVLGDANKSGSVTVTDVVVTSQYVLEMNPEPFDFEAADVNADGNITVTDVSRIAWMVLNPTLNVPKRAPAIWNNGDSMSAQDITIAMGETRTVSIALDNEIDYNAFQIDLTIPEGMIASNFHLKNRAGCHALNVNRLSNGKTRALCFSPTLNAIRGNEGAVLTFDVTATTAIDGVINVDGIELVTTDCQTVRLDAFAISVNSATAVNELAVEKSIVRVDYYNAAGQRLDHPVKGLTLVVTTYTDGTRMTQKIIK